MDDRRSAVRDLLSELAEQLGRAATVPEVAELLHRSLPVDDPRVDAERAPARLVAKAGRREIRGDTAAIDELPDATFVAASDLFGTLIGDAGAVRLPALADALTEELRHAPGDLVTGFGDDVRLVLTGPRASRRARPGDVVAIPSGPGYHLAVVITRNRFGTAYGIFRHRSPQARMPEAGAEVRPFPIYSDDQSVRSGRWRIVGSAPDLLGLFPDDPEIYHMNGIAETASGTIRPVPDEEEAAVGLTDDSYRQGYLSEHLEEELTSGAIPGL